MTYRNWLALLLIFGLGLALGAVLIGLPLLALAQSPVDTTFTYQGRLIQSGAYVDGVTCDFRFGLYDLPAGGSPLGSGVQSAAADLSDGYFTVDLDFGDVFDGSKRYLEVAVQCPGDAGFTTLSGRVDLKATPYALYARNATTVGSVLWSDVISKPAGFADNVDDVGALNDFVCASGQVLKWQGGAEGFWKCDSDIGVTIHSNLAGLDSDDHLQYLPRNGSRPMTANLSMGGYRLQNLADGQAASDAVTMGQAVKVGDPAGGDLTGTFTMPTVIALQGHAVAPITPTNSQSLIWNGAENRWVPGQATISGAAGGDLTGTYPNPDIAPDAVGAPEIATDAVGSAEIATDAVNSAEIAADAVGSSEIATNAVGMDELNVPIGTNAGSLFLGPYGTGDVVYFFPSGNSFTPGVDGQCLVIVSAQIRSSGSSSVNAAYLSTAKRESGQPDSSDGADEFSFNNSASSPAVTVNRVWNVFSGRLTRFGCYLRIADGNVADDETLYCRVSYMCE